MNETVINKIVGFQPGDLIVPTAECIARREMSPDPIELDLFAASVFKIRCAEGPDHFVVFWVSYRAGTEHHRPPNTVERYGDLLAPKKDIERYDVPE